VNVEPLRHAFCRPTDFFARSGLACSSAVNATSRRIDLEPANGDVVAAVQAIAVVVGVDVAKGGRDPVQFAGAPSCRGSARFRRAGRATGL